ncbi:hypothetical protein RRG08_006015 [Elysia crispata]|uniref:Uncharacterized protein n=1 Tax=Elysia crispata TaxID=231223 RepID=A0AAE1DXA0_9GAST|nr:hypothetical protein RRG08_006015 [Elysia crispata]
MAASMTPSVLAAKEKVIDHIEDMFHEKLKSFTTDVKTKMRSVSREAAIQVFELALLFLTQAVPDLGGFESASDVVQDAQQNLSEKSSELQEKASSFQHRVQNDLDKLNKASESNTHQILGLRKLQKLLSDKTKISKTTAVTTPSTSQASASAAATPCGPPKSLSQRSTFSARSPHDIRFPHIMDTKGGFILIDSGILFEILSSNVRYGECGHYSVATAFKNSSKYGFCHEIELKYQNCSVWSTGFKTSKESSKSGHSEINLTMVTYVRSLGRGFSTLQHFSFYVNSPPPMT